MSFERSHGKMRPSLPRSREVTTPATEREPDRGRDAGGRFTSPNAIANGRGWRTTIARMAGRELQGEARELGKASWNLYRALMLELPHDGASVRSLVAAQARSAILAARFASHAAEVGFDTDAGRAALELSVKLDARAERLAISSADLADRLAKADRLRKPIDVHAEVARAFAPPRAQGGT